MKRNSIVQFSFFLLFFCLCFRLEMASGSIGFQGMPKPPPLTVVLVIDQLRSDSLSLFKKRFLPAQAKGRRGGFQYLISNGSYIPMAEYEYLTNQTCPGHVTIASGSYPYQNGIASNEWYDPVKGTKVYCVEDENSFSPKNIIGTTFGDELKLSGVPSRVVSIALKDRSAVALGGRKADLAVWFDEKKEAWETGPYYSSELPDFVKSLNVGIRKTLDLGDLLWTLDPGQTGFQKPSDFKKRSSKITVTDGFPKKLSAKDNSPVASPFGASLVMQAGMAAVDSYHLGQKKNTFDVLALSLSHHDYVGHSFGPHSLETEDLLVKEDRMLSDFLNELSKRIPVEQVNFILTSDHGVAPAPELLENEKIPGGFVVEAKLRSQLESEITKKFGLSPTVIRNFSGYSIHLDVDMIEKKKIKVHEVEDFSKKILLQSSEIAFVVTGSEARAAQFPPGKIGEAFRKTWSPGSFPHLVLMSKPFYIRTGIATNHMTPYSYDRYVPLIFAGPSFRKNHLVKNPVRMVDIAPTLSFTFGVVAPSLSEGNVLAEILK